jgi:RHS repeat-associated protein
MDAAGNIYRREEHDDREYGPGGRLLRADGFHYAYDADGNQTKKFLQGDTAKAPRDKEAPAWSYAWNGHGLLQSVTRPDGLKLEFEYDAFARRTKKRVLSLEGGTEKETEFVWDGNQVVHELDSETGLTTWHWQPETFTPIAKEKQGKRWSIASDHLGTPTEMYDELGDLAWKMQLDVFGVPTFEVGERDDCPWRWPGQYADDETGLSYNRWRYFSPYEHRYLSQDPIRLLGGTRMYGYVEAPDTYFDPLGENKVLGDLGEAYATYLFKSSGYTVLGAMQNNSGHGVDLVVRNSAGALRLVEVKVNGGRMSAAQARGPTSFGRTRANRALTVWRSAGPEVASIASEIEQAILHNQSVDGFLIKIKINPVTTTIDEVKVKRWCD